MAGRCRRRESIPHLPRLPSARQTAPPGPLSCLPPSGRAGSPQAAMHQLRRQPTPDGAGDLRELHPPRAPPAPTEADCLCAAVSCDATPATGYATAVGSPTLIGSFATRRRWRSVCRSCRPGGSRSRPSSQHGTILVARRRPCAPSVRCSPPIPPEPARSNSCSTSPTATTRQLRCPGRSRPSSPKPAWPCRPTTAGAAPTGDARATSMQYRSPSSRPSSPSTRTC